MSTEANGIARDQLRAFVERVERVEEEIATLNSDKSDIYKEARAVGFDVKVLRKVVAKRKLETHVREEQDAIFDMYWDALYGAPVHVHTRENIEQFDANPRLIKQVVDGMQTEAGRAALIAAVDIMIEREEAEEFQAKASGDNGATEQDIEDTADSVTGDASRSSRGDDSPAAISQSDDGAIAAVNGKAGLANADGVEPPSSDHFPDQSEEGGHDAQQVQHVNLDRRRHFQSEENTSETTEPAKQAGGEHEVATGNAERVPTSVTGEGAANTALPADGVAMESVPPAPMKRPDFAGCFPELSNAAYAQLHDEIHANGICQPIVRHGDVIVEGWDRYNISRELGFDYPVKSYSGSDVLLDVIDWQRASRNFTPAQERKIAAELAKELPHRADDIMAAFGLAEALEGAE